MKFFDMKIKEKSVLKAMIIFVATSSEYLEKDKNLSKVYELLATKHIKELNTMVNSLSCNHPSKNILCAFFKLDEKLINEIIFNICVALEEQFTINELKEILISNANEIELSTPQFFETI